MFLLFHISSVLILSMEGSLFLFISVLAFIASRQKWESILFTAWMCFGSTVAFSVLCMLTMGEKNVLLFVTKLTYYLYFARNIFLLVFTIHRFHSSFFDIQVKHISFYFLKYSFVVIFPFP